MDYIKEEIFNNGTAALFYWPEVKILENRWLKKVSLDSNAYRKPFTAALKFAEEKPVFYYLSDLRNQGVVPITEKNWFKNEVLPKAAELGLKYGAVVTNGNVFKTYYMNAMIKVGNIFHVPVKTFNNIDKAIAWLLSNQD